jgi:hypothetical protein
MCSRYDLVSFQERKSRKNAVMPSLNVCLEESNSRATNRIYSDNQGVPAPGDDPRGRGRHIAARSACTAGRAHAAYRPAHPVR